ncbi:MAG: hypothetical protein JJ863_19150 [Deltaproteobacteria bacterium]|nr:hypothetical protein [Deltaproteobacteria bacterium]
MATHYEASSTVETTFPFECACGFSGEGSAVGEGYGQSQSGGLFEDHHAESKALDDAEGKAWADAISSVELAPCPSCGQRDGAKWRAWIQSRLLPSLGWGILGGVLGTVGLFLMRQEMDSYPLVVGAASFMTVTALVLGHQVARKRTRSAGVIITAR